MLLYGPGRCRQKSSRFRPVQSVGDGIASPARVVETRLHMRPAEEKCHKACQENAEGDFLRSGLASETCGIAAISSDSQSSAAKFLYVPDCGQPLRFPVQPKGEWLAILWLYLVSTTPFKPPNWLARDCVPEAVALPRNVGCRVPALRSAEVA